jgi:hypothetical protein
MAAQISAPPEAVLAAAAIQALDACIHQLDPVLDVGYARIAERCPQLEPTLAASPSAPWLPRDWNRSGNELSAAGLAELRTLLQRPAPRARTAAPRVARVGAVLASLAVHDAARPGWWTRIKQWLRELFTPRPPNADDNWLRRLFGETALSQAVLEAITWVALAIIVLLAAAIVVNELRVAGVLPSRRARTARGAGADAGPAAARSLHDVAEASPVQQPRLLLELIIARLRAQQRLPPARALTLQELTRAARLTEPADRARLAELTQACERIRFAARELPPPLLAAALARGRELLGSLESVS